jgi:hypothetical protein
MINNDDDDDDDDGQLAHLLGNNIYNGGVRDIFYISTG